MIDLMLSKYPNSDIVIHSGMGEIGELKQYKGKRTARAIKTRLTKERYHGDRWAKAYINIYDDVYNDMENPYGCDMREIPKEYFY